MVSLHEPFALVEHARMQKVAYRQDSGHRLTFAGKGLWRSLDHVGWRRGTPATRASCHAIIDAKTFEFDTASIRWVLLAPKGDSTISKFSNDQI